MTYPGAHTKSPWPGHLDLAVNDKTFAYLSMEGDPFKISCKLPRSCEDALSLPFASPAAYGLGKSGWVTAQLASGPVPVELFKAWIDESHRTQAPKRLLAGLGAGSPAAAFAAAPRYPPPRSGGWGKKGPPRNQRGKRPRQGRTAAPRAPRRRLRAAAPPA